MKYWHKRTPRLIQMEAVECGAASLGIILGYYGRFIPLEQLRIDCGVSRDGANAFKVLQAANKHGLIGKGQKLDVQGLQQLFAPAIVFWKFEHFLVLEGFGKHDVYINDPATGPRTISYDQFKQDYSGIVLSFEKTAQFRKVAEKALFLRSVMERLRYAISPVLYLIFIGLLLILPGLAFPAFTRIFVDEFLLSHGFIEKDAFMGAILLTMTLVGILTGLKQYCLNRLNVKLSFDFSNRFLWHLLRLPILFYAQRHTGEIAFRMNFNDLVTHTLTGPLATTILDFLITFFYGFFIMSYDVSIGLMAILALFLNLGFMLTIQRSRTNTYAQLQQEIGKGIGFGIGGIQQIETIKASGYESSFFSKLSGYFARNVNATQSIGKKDALLVNAPVLFQGLVTAGLLTIGGWRVIDGRLTIGTLMALYLLLLSFLQPVTRFVNFNQMIQTMKIQINRLNDVLNYQVDRAYQKKPTIQKIKLETIAFQSVTFGYTTGDAPLITDLSFELTPGKRIALVGPSGCGKSTIAKLSTALYPPWQGKILYDGVEFEAIPSEIFQNSLASVDQEIALFEGTIWDNLTLWDDTVTEEMLGRAAKDAMIHDFIIARHPLGYHAPLMEGGKNLSGGQRQMLEIARALVKNPSLLIMDEATSALDSETEKTISDNLQRRGCACLMIAHRLSTIRDCDEIIVLDRGKIVARGQHQELRSQPGIYKDLVDSEK